LAIIAALSLERNALEAEKKIFGVFIFCLVASACTVFKFYGPTLSLEAWHTNSYSACAAMMLCYCAGELMSARRHPQFRLWSFASISLLALIVGTSAGSNIAAACGLAFGSMVTRSWKILAVCSLLLVVALVIGITGEDAMRVALGGKNKE